MFVGDTLWAESEVTGVRESNSRAEVGIVEIRCRGVNQRAQVVVEFGRTFMAYRRTAPEVTEPFPTTNAPWTVAAPNT